MRARSVIGAVGACVALAAVAVSAQGSPADASSVRPAAAAHAETLRSCEYALVRAVDYAEPEWRVLRRDCQYLTRHQRRVALAYAAQVTS